MCELCLKPDEKTVLIELRNIHRAPGAKFEAGIEAITKALGFDSGTQKAEVSPFRAVRDLERISKERVEEGLLKLWDAIMRKWLGVEKAKGTETFVLNGRIFLNPKTGKPLTNAQWAVIKKDILRAFDYLYAVEEERIANHALALGRVLKGLSLQQAVGASYKSLKAKVDLAMKQIYSPQWRNAVTFAQQEAGAMIVELKQKQYKDIHNVLQTGIKHRKSSGELSQDLFDKFGDWNRDWRRIAETEIGNAQNNGQLLTELERAKEGETIFMRGIASAEACPWCRNEVDQKIVVLLEEPPPGGGDQVTIDGETYTAIWPGKSNYGRSRRNWWVAAGTQHPHCRCTWVKYVPGFEKWDTAFRDAINQARVEGAKKQKLPDSFESTLKPVPWE